MKIETKELVHALTPFYNGCSFSLKVMSNGDFIIQYGCYLLVNLQTSAKEYLRQLILMDNKDNDWEKSLLLTQNILVDPIQEVKVEVLKTLKTNCSHCGSPLFEKMLEGK